MTRYHAPPVSYPAGRVRLEAVVLVAFWLLVAGLCGLAAVQGADPWRHPRALVTLAVGAGLWLLAGWMAWRCVCRAPSGHLRWREGGWSWQTRPDVALQTVIQVELACDLQQLVLLRLHGVPGVPGWLWLERSRDPQRWDDVRRAVWATRH